MRRLALVLALLSAPASPAESVVQQMRGIESALARITQEQHAIYQQFQMVQELRRNDERQMLPLQSYTVPTTPPNYDDVKRQEEARAQRVKEHQYELDRLYARYRELEEQKRPLLDTLAELAQRRIEEPPAEAPKPAQPKPAVKP